MKNKCERHGWVTCSSIHSLNTLSMRKFGICKCTASTRYRVKSVYSDTRVVFLGNNNSMRVTYCTDMYFHILDFCVDECYFGTCDNLIRLGSKGETQCLYIVTPMNASYIYDKNHFSRCPKDMYWMID